MTDGLRTGARKRPPVQQCRAHGPYRAWRPVCPDCLREQQAIGRRQEQLELGLPTMGDHEDGERRGLAYGEFPPGF